ncbi:T7 tail fiber protein [Proteus phage PM 85]|uniref:T7 tail fiber protein n=1 Tax=Proteus phage PM 85 TaxID=1560283 RepID=A0A0F6NYB3_9CAUD|nr:T7 tail fiber protein [Proteus phage PM 85]AIW03131.1 T7 tail fiber protein [Proteus phage PM 85]
MALTKANKNVMSPNVPTLQSFKLGGVALTKTDLFKTTTGELYYWDGEVPHKVEPNTEPKSEGVGYGKWIMFTKTYSSLFYTGGSVVKGDIIQFGDTKYKATAPTDITPNSSPEDYGYNFVEVGSMLYTPSDNIDNFSGSITDKILKALKAYGKAYLPKGEYLFNKPLLIEEDAYIYGAGKGITKVVWAGAHKPSIPDVVGRVGVFDVSNKNASYTLQGLSFSTNTNIDAYVNVLRGFVKSDNCVFNSGSKYPVVKNSSREHNGYDSLNGEMSTTNCEIYTTNGVTAYGKGGIFYKEENKTKSEVHNCILDCSDYYETCVGFGHTSFTKNTVRDSNSPYYNLPVYYLQTDTEWSVTSGQLTIDRNYIKGTGVLSFSPARFDNQPCVVMVICSSGIVPKVNGEPMQELRPTVFTADVSHFTSLTLNVTDNGSLYRCTVLSKKSQAKMYVAYADYQECSNNKFLNVNRAMTSGIDARNIVMKGNYTLGGRCLTVDTVSYRPSEFVFEHNVATTDVSGNIFEVSIDNAWITGSSVDIKGNQFLYCGYFDRNNTAIAINTATLPNSIMSGVNVDGNTFIGLPSRAVRVTSGVCVIGTNYHDSVASLDSVSIYQASTGGKIIFSTSQTKVIDTSEFTYNNGFGTYILKQTGTINITLPSKVYHQTEWYEGKIVVSSKDVSLKFTTKASSATINGESSATLTGKLIYNVYNTGDNNFIVE